MDWPRRGSGAISAAAASAAADLELIRLRSFGGEPQGFVPKAAQQSFRGSSPTRGRQVAAQQSFRGTSPTRGRQAMLTAARGRQAMLAAAHASTTFASAPQSSKSLLESTTSPTLSRGGHDAMVAGALAAPRAPSVGESEASGRKSHRTSASGARRSVQGRRTNRGPTYSQWEGRTYIPVVQQFWARVLKTHSKMKMGLQFYKRVVEEDETLLHLFPEDHRATMGVQFMCMIDAIVTALGDPHAVVGKMRRMAPTHSARGVKPEMILPLGKALMGMLKDLMGDKVWTSHVQTAWDWLWAYVSECFKFSMHNESEKDDLVAVSFDSALDNVTEEAMGNIIYDNMHVTAPSLKSIFSKPKKLLAVRLMEMITTLVSFSNDDERMIEQVSWLGLRHLAYGTKREHGELVGKVLISSVEHSMGDEWTQELNKAWWDLWNKAFNILIESVEGSGKYAQTMQDIWAAVVDRCTTQEFGMYMRKNLLMGTQWVVTMSQRILDRKNGKKPGPRLPVVEDKDHSSSGHIEHEKDRDSQQGDVGADGLNASTTSRTELNASSRRSVERAEAKNDANAEEVEQLGERFWDMLNTLINLIWEPEQQNVQIIVVATNLFQVGIRAKHLPTMGTAVRETLRMVLQGEWTTHHKEAVDWFWGTITRTMAKTLDTMERDDALILRECWELSKKINSSEKLGDLFFSELCKTAPHVIHLFKRPKKIQAFQFVHAIDMLVQFAEDPESFFDELKPLIIRHIKYGVKADYVKPFGQAILKAVKCSMAENYSDQQALAWATLWVRVSSTVQRSLNVGTNLVVVSLVQGDPDKLATAIECAPRGERFQWLVEVDVNGEIISPLYWAIRDGKFALAEYVIDHLLEMRADRDAYYYGRELLFEKHPDIVTLLCTDCPALMETLLDGLQWHSHSVNNGLVRVNYYVKELYGDPNKVQNVWRGPLAKITQKGQPSMFNHPVMDTLLNMKWKRFALLWFVGIQVFYAIILIMWTIGFVVWQDECAAHAVGLRLATGAIGLITSLGMTWLIISQLVKDHGKHAQLMGQIIRIPQFLTNPWNLARYISYLVLVVSAFTEPCWNDAPPIRRKLGCRPWAEKYPTEEELAQMAEESFVAEIDWHTAITSISTFLIWIQFIQVLILSKRLAAFTYTISSMFVDVTRNLFVILVIMVSFSFTLSTLRQPGYESSTQAVVNLLYIALAMSSAESEALEDYGFVVLIAFVIIIEIGFLNILIAQLALIYERLSVDKEGYAKMNRAYTCVEIESFLSQHYRKKLWDELNFDLPLQFEPGDDGPSGGVQVLEPASVRAQVKYVPDRVLRFPGEASPLDPWPVDPI